MELFDKRPNTVGLLCIARDMSHALVRTAVKEPLRVLIRVCAEHAAIFGSPENLAAGYAGSGFGDAPGGCGLQELVCA